MPRPRRINPQDIIDITPRSEVAEDASPSENLPAVTDPVANAVAEIEQKAREVVSRAREKDMVSVPAIEEVTDLILESLKATDWAKVPEKDRAITFGILTDKRGKLLDDIAPQRKEARKANKKRTTFEFNFANGTAKVSVDDSGGDE